VGDVTVTAAKGMMNSDFIESATSRPMVEHATLVRLTHDGQTERSLKQNKITESLHCSKLKF